LKRSKSKIAVLCGLISLLLLFSDQITKAWAEGSLAGKVQPFLGKAVKFAFYKNTGMAFGLLDDNPAAMAIVTALTVVMIVGIAVLFFTVFKKNTAIRVVLAIIEAGAIGNLIDRVLLRYVRDFIDVSFFGFGICNLADFYITFGAVALILILIFTGEDALIPIGKLFRKKRKKDE